RIVKHIARNCLTSIAVKTVTCLKVHQQEPATPRIERALSRFYRSITTFAVIHVTNQPQETLCAAPWNPESAFPRHPITCSLACHRHNNVFEVGSNRQILQHPLIGLSQQS